MPSPTLPSSELPPAPLLTLGLQYEPEALNRVKQHWHVTFSRQRKMSVFSKRIMARVLEQIKEDDSQLREYYQLRVSSLATGTDLDVANTYRFAKKALYELAQVQWEFEDEGQQEWYFRPLLDGTKKQRVGIKDGIITVILNPQLAPYFVQIAGHYSTYNLDGYMGLHSWYSMRFFEILSAFRDTGWWEINLEDYRLLMDCGPELDKFGEPKKDKQGVVKMKLADTRDLLNKTILGAQKELAVTPYAFDFHPLYEQERTSRGRPKIVGLRFDLLNRQITAVPPSWMADTKAAPVITNLRGFKVSDRNIALYLKAITLDGAKKMLREWQLKENGSQKIDDHTKYCNAAFVRQGKAAIEKHREEVLQAKQFVQQVLFADAVPPKKPTK